MHSAACCIPHPLAPLPLPLSAGTARTTRHPGARAWWGGRRRVALLCLPCCPRHMVVGGPCWAGCPPEHTRLFCCACRSAAARSGSTAASTTTSRCAWWWVDLQNAAMPRGRHLTRSLPCTADVPAPGCSSMLVWYGLSSPSTAAGWPPRRDQHELAQAQDQAGQQAGLGEMRGGCCC